MQEHLIKVERTVRYYTLGELNSKTKSVWFVIHGYGQLAQFFIKKFVQIQDEETVVIAPEAISRFYLDDKYNRVGASWMTKDLRQSEIDEYVAYLNQVYGKVLKDSDLTDVEVNLLGFSQGCATVCRWLGDGHIKCNRLLLWAGFFSNGISEVIEPKKLHNIKTYYVYGDNDEFLTAYPEIAQKFQENMIAEINPEIISFEGKHTIDEATLKEIVDGWK
jgi:predicted esterase